jgi:hypothetical protein
MAPMLLAGLALTRPVLAQFDLRDDYQQIGYVDEARRNPVARLHESLAHGQVALDYRSQRGYLESLLGALEIDPSSQTLVFSASSMQRKLIGPRTPRALYFNDTTYVGFVQNSSIVEVVTVDDQLGLVFYTFDNVPETRTYFERANQTCLVCHDSQGTMVGGVPMLLALSSVHSIDNTPLKNFSGNGSVEDSTPIEDRWGGWYVTGRHGLQAHLGNILLGNRGQLENLDDYRTWNLDTLAGSGFVDTSRYLRDTSDIVALLVLEHQLTVQNQITYVKFKAPTALRRRGLDDAVDALTWDALPDVAQQLLSRMLDKLVRQMTMADYAPIGSRISGIAEYERWFLARGPKDAAGRSLREFDLAGNLFAYPLSYLVYSSSFDTLPAYAKDYVYQRLAAYLSGAESFDWNSDYSDEAKRIALEILAVTKPDFAPYMRRR